MRAHKPAELDLTVVFEGEETHLGHPLGEVVADEANELHVEQVDDLLGLLGVGQIDEAQFTIVRHEPLVHHNRVVNLD